MSHNARRGGRDALLQLALLLLVRLPRLPQLLLGRADLLFPPGTGSGVCHVSQNGRMRWAAAPLKKESGMGAKQRERHPDWGACARGAHLASSAE